MVYTNATQCCSRERWVAAHGVSASVTVVPLLTSSANAAHTACYTVHRGPAAQGKGPQAARQARLPARTPRSEPLASALSHGFRASCASPCVFNPLFEPGAAGWGGAGRGGAGPLCRLRLEVWTTACTHPGCPRARGLARPTTSTPSYQGDPARSLTCHRRSPCLLRTHHPATQAMVRPTPQVSPPGCGTMRTSAG